MRLWILGALLMLTGYASSVMGQHSACQQLNLSTEVYSQEDLIKIAQSCKDPAVSELYFNRAYHLRMLEQYRFFERSLSHYRGDAGQAYIDAYRIHIGLAEAFIAKHLSLNKIKAVEQLNEIYDQSSEIAEMRFRGYDLLANRMQREFML
jgi:hypothetical protein